MGHCISHFKRESANLSRPNSNTDQCPSSKYPLPLESLMLKNIKRQYDEKQEPNEVGSQENSNLSSMTSIISTSSNNDDTTTKPVQLMKALERILLFPGYDNLTDRGDGHAIKTILKESEEDFSIQGCHSTEAVFGSESEGPVCTAEDDALESCCFKLTDFPILVVENLMKHLPPSTILTLRATCQTTKAWVEDDVQTLADFKLRLEPETCEYQSPPDTAPWSNISLPYVFLHSEFVQDTIDKYCDIIWSLEIYGPRSFNNSIVANYPCQDRCRLFDIIHRCPNLQHLTLCRLDTLTILGEPQLTNLRVLSIDRIQWMKHSDFDLFEDLIMKCPHLEYLKIPEFEILGSLAFIFYDSNTQPEVLHLVYPLMKYLESYRQQTASAGNHHRRKLYIDVVEFEDFKLCSSEAFYELSRKCVESNAVLMNVYFVPRDAILRNQQDIVESFASMFGFIKIDFQAELWKNLEVMECWIEDFPDDMELTMRQLSFLKTIQKIKTLKSLTIRLSVDDPQVCSAALEACVGQEYKGIQKLILRRHHANTNNQVRIPAGFGHAFGNIKHFYLQELDSTNEDLQGVWGSLPNLEELFIYKCPYLTQAAFLGQPEDNPPVLQLTKLQIMVIFLHDGVCGFDDIFLRRALRNMRLKGFALRGVAGVEFTEDGMLSLLNSPFHDTVEDFEAPSSLFRPSLSPNYWNFYVALPKKELRQNRIWLSCSVLLNSLSSRKHPYDFKQRTLGI